MTQTFVWRKKNVTCSGCDNNAKATNSYLFYLYYYYYIYLFYFLIYTKCKYTFSAFCALTLASHLIPNTFVCRCSIYSIGSIGSSISSSNSNSRRWERDYGTLAAADMVTGTAAMLSWLAAALLICTVRLTLCCRISEFMCKSTGGCVRLDEYCDGKYDCPDRSDEPPSCTGTHNRYSLKLLHL